MSAQPHLRIVDTGTGEIHDSCPQCAAKDDEIRGLQRDLRGWMTRYANLERDKRAEARSSDLWPAAQAVFRVWRQATGHGRSPWTEDRFWQIEPFLSNPKYGPDLCLRAVAGIAFDHYVSSRKNGTAIHYDEWSRCFKDADHVERFANAAPQGWRDDPVFARTLAELKPQR